MKMYKFAPLGAMLFAAAALAQQVDVNGKDFLSGAGDAKLANIAQQAAASGKALQVTAPAYWQEKIAAKLHAGAADVTIRTSDGFFENVLVKIVDAAPTKPVEPSAEAKAAAAEKAAAQRAEAEKAAAEQAAAEQAAAERAAAQAAAARAAAARIAAEKAAAEKAAADQAAAEKAAAEKAAAEKLAAEKAVAAKLAASRDNMLKNLNGGRPADGDVHAGELQIGDVVYVDGSVRGVVRRVGTQIRFYWLQGELNLDRVELTPNGDGRYKVMRKIDPDAAPVLRTRGEMVFAAAVPAADSAVRKSLLDSYAEGREIIDTVAPSGLRQGDMIYTGQGAALVVRRAGGQFVRYWLDGSLDLGQIGLQDMGGNAYKVLSDTIK